MTKEEYQKLRNESLKIMRELFEDNANEFVCDMNQCVFGSDGRWYIGDRVLDKQIEDEVEYDEYEPLKENSQTYKKYKSAYKLLGTVSQFCNYDEDQFIADLASIFPKDGRWYVGDYAKERPHEIRG